MSIASLISANKKATSLVLAFVIGSTAVGYLVWNSWDNYATVTAEYSSKAAQLDLLSKSTIFPSKRNLEKLEKTLSQDQANLEKLQQALQIYRIHPFGTFDKVKPQNQPQYFQDSLRAEVTTIRTLAINSSSTLPPTFYLGLDEFENRLPQPEQLPTLSKQLTVLDWLGKTVVGLKNVVIEEFTLVTPKEQSPVGQKQPSTISNLPYASLGSVRITLRCGQGTFRELINALSTAPHFLIIEDIKVQNSVGEPPLKNSAPTVEQPAEGGATVQRLPIIVGRESLNVTLKIRMIDFPAPENKLDSLK
jgi:hypothetical protein